MAESVVEKPVCEKCGSDVREGTTYCYHCGARIAAANESSVDPEKTLLMGSNGDGASADQKVGRSPDTKERVRNAATERKKARVTSRKPVEYRWEPADDLGFTLTWTIIVTLIVALIAGLMVFWK